MSKTSLKDSTSQPLALQVSNLNFSYDQNQEMILRDVNFELKTASINIVIGPNGSGKSTLLKIILGLLEAEGGISFFDENGEIISRKEAHVGYVPQKFLFDTSIPITVKEFLKLTLSNCAKHKNTGENEIQQVLDSVGAGELIAKKLKDLSGGQLQRVILARAFLHHPRLLILDEPESGIDIEGERFFYEILQKKARETGLTALIASHEMEIVSKYADQVLCLNKTIICAGTSGQVLTTKNFEKLYGIDKQLYKHDHAHSDFHAGVRKFADHGHHNHDL